MKKRKLVKLLRLLVVVAVVVGAGAVAVYWYKNRCVSLEEARIGDYVKFGKYEQDNNEGNGAEDIEWVVISESGDRLLLMSKYYLEYLPFERDYLFGVSGNVDWSNCSLREWLNEEFLLEAFSESEQKQILSLSRETKITKNEESFGCRADAYSNEKVFLLSSYELEEYIGFGEETGTLVNDYLDESMKALYDTKPTRYVRQKEEYKTEKESDMYNDNIYTWLLRDLYYSGNTNYLLRSVDLGILNVMAFTKIIDNGLVRPAIWVSVEGRKVNENKQMVDAKGIQCELRHTEAVSKIMGNLTRDIQVYANANGGTGEYIYTFIVTNEYGEIVAFAEDITSSGVAFTVSDNYAMEVLVEVKDSEGASGTFLYQIDQYE